MGCKNISHIFYMDMETIAYMDNNDLCTCICAQPHTMYDRSKRISIPSPPPIEPDLVATPRDSVLGWKNAESMVYIELFVVYFLGLSQSFVYNRRHIRCTLFHSMYKFFQTNYVTDLPEK